MIKMHSFRWWPKNLAGQFIWLLLAALLFSQIVTALILLQERDDALKGLNKKRTVNQIYATIRLLRDSPENLHARILRAASSENIRFWFEPLSTSADIYYETESNPFMVTLKKMGISNIVIRNQEFPTSLFKQRDESEKITPYTVTILDEKKRSKKPLSHEAFPKEWNYLALQLPNGRWLNVANKYHRGAPFFPLLNLVSILITAIILVCIIVFMVRRITQPLKRLTIAADRLGRGEYVEPLQESGPSDLQTAISSFNKMNERLNRFVKDRTNMLAAVSHDLRTPITTLKLRTELLDNKETQTAFLNTLDEMQAIADATLCFVRDDANNEAIQSVDLVALLDSICEEFKAQGKQAKFLQEDQRAYFYSCRLISLKRAINNLVENAIKYGHCASVSIEESAGQLMMHIDDNGAGIPDDDIEEMFVPFSRLEKSRNQLTGGVGLGLSIARSIVRSHGGDIRLSNLKTSGLRATLILPLQQS